MTRVIRELFASAYPTLQDTACRGPDKFIRNRMLNWAFTFLVLAIVAAVLGFGGIAADSAYIAKILFVVFLVIAVIGFASGRRVSIG
jgi:uncharacterized membrane protein YtjA (UPF0391 family)